MAGKSNKGKNRKAGAASQSAPQSGSNVSEPPISEPSPPISEPSPPISDETPATDYPNGSIANGNTAPNELDTVKPEEVEKPGNGSANDSEHVNSELDKSENGAPEPPKQGGDVHLYPVTVKTQGGEKLELQLSPGDSVMDVRQFLLDAPETCFFTCYDLLLHTKDASIHHLEDYNEISEIADITCGESSLEMVAALYDDRSIRAHVNRTRELLSLSSLHSSISTSLALTHDKPQTTPANSTDPQKAADIRELDNIVFMENNSDSLTNLLSPPSKEIKCVESIIFSSFNPPPSYRRLCGDLIYLDVATLEGNKYCITGTTKSFYVNSSTENILDPRTSKAGIEATTLVGLLQKISSKFKKGFREILECKANAHPFENVPCLLPPNSWLGLHPVPDHKRDAARAEESLTLTFGSEMIGMQRDWNEELQSCREFPHTSPQERILRDRALYKVTSDFVDAAISGAKGVITRCIPPINPTDPECFHMYVHNNIFFSFAVDADLEQLPRKQQSSSSDANINNKVVSDAPAAEVQAQAQLAESEQATYASANNDLKGTKAYQEADVPGLYNLAMAIIDYRGHRVVAQSVLPGILQGDKSDSLLYGSVDNGKKVCWSEDFHSKVVAAAKRLHLKEHSVYDGSGNVYKLAAPVECKGIVGSDDRHYLLDLMRVTPRDANYTGTGSRFCILRPELITAFCHAQAAEKSKSDATEAVEKTEPEEKQAPQEESNDELLFNPNVFTEFKLAGTPEEIAVDEENVRKAGLHLKDVVLPKFIQDLCALEVSPMDGQTLTEALHAHGINIRYIGKVAEGTKHLPHLWDLCSNEIIVRCGKHVLKEILRDTEDHDLAHAISHFFNCLFGKIHESTKNQKKETGHQVSGKSSKKGKSGRSTRKKQSSSLNMTSDSLWSDIKDFANLKYQFELSDDSKLRVKKIPVVRDLCQKVGVTIAARKYDLDSAAPFQVSDILDLKPVIKHSIPISSEAKELVETGKVQLAEGMLGEAYTLFSEAFTILQQVTGPMHREVANCCRYLAMVLYHAGDMGGAIMQQHKELIINERCLGLDHPDTAHSYGNMALFYHGLNQTELALKHMSRALLLLSLSSGPDHPDVAATFINVAMMYQDIGKMNIALRYLQEALKKNERLLGPQHIQTAVCYHALAIAFNCMGAFKLSHQHEKSTYDILVKQLGEEDSRTRDSLNWMKTFKMRELQSNAQKQQKGQVMNAASAQKAIDLLKAHPDLMHAFQAAASANGGGSSSNAGGGGGEETPLPVHRGRGGGVDERAARATAEVRKKAAARGLLIRPHGVPVQAMPPLTQLMNIINSSGDAANANANANGHSSSIGPQEGQPPVGLGSGLATLDAKKQKPKPKPKPTS